jgi:ATP-dependent exoDNAse (exonuclease V) alpha subunit
MLGQVTATTEERGSFSVQVHVDTPEGPRLVEVVGSLAKLAFFLRPAYAVTVHDSQGGEFDRVDVLLPASPDCPLCTRELLYTAVSRARQTAALWTLRQAYTSYVPRLSRPSTPRVTPLAVLLPAELKRALVHEHVEAVSRSAASR